MVNEEKYSMTIFFMELIAHHHYFFIEQHNYFFFISNSVEDKEMTSSTAVMNDDKKALLYGPEVAHYVLRTNRRLARRTKGCLKMPENLPVLSLVDMVAGKMSRRATYYSAS